MVNCEQIRADHWGEWPQWALSFKTQSKAFKGALIWKKSGYPPGGVPMRRCLCVCVHVCGRARLSGCGRRAYNRYTARARAGCLCGSVCIGHVKLSNKAEIGSKMNGFHAERVSIIWCCWCMGLRICVCTCAWRIVWQSFKTGNWVENFVFFLPCRGTLSESWRRCHGYPHHALPGGVGQNEVKSYCLYGSLWSN